MAELRQSFIMRLISPLTYPQKFVFISCLFGFSLLVSNYFMIKSQNTSISFVDKEMKGIEIQKPLRKLMQDINQHMLLIQLYNLGDSQLKADILKLESDISTDLNLSIKIEQEFVSYLGETPYNLSPEPIAKKWSELIRSEFEASTESNYRAHKEIISDIISLMGNVSEASNLTFDTEYESSYLIDHAMVKSITSQELIALITSKAYNIIRMKTTTIDDKYELVGFLSLLRGYINQTNLGSQSVISYSQANPTEIEVENKLKEPLLHYFDVSIEFINYIEKNFIKSDKAPENTQDLITISQKALEANFVFWNATLELLEEILKKRLDSYLLQQRISVLITMIGAISGFVIGFITMRQISLPLTNLVQAARLLSEGDLSARVPLISNDEVGQAALAFNQMADSFQELIGQLQWTGIQLTTSTTEIAATAKQQEATIVEQEATTKEIAATAREISTSAKEFARTMSEVNNNAEQTSSLATSGKSGLMKMETIMRQMVDAASNIASKLAVLNEKAGTITSIITTISKVADQTNLLSLNAAIEAEKAGEYGRSFAVIAREIRRLADQTANATLDIEKMVNEMVSAVSAGVMGVDKFSEEINTGVKHVSTVSEQLTQIIEQVQQQTTNFEAVNQGMQNQSQGAEQINESINQLSEAAQQTTQSIRQFHNAIEQLNNAAQEMQNAVSKIKR